MGNFKEELKLMIDKNAIIQVASYEALDEQLKSLLDDKDHQSSLKKSTNKLTHNAEEVLDSYTTLILDQKTPT